MTLIVDASVALKWVLNEEDRDRARALIGAESLAAPEFLLLECGNTFAVKVRRGLMSPQQARRALTIVRDEVGVRFWPIRPHLSTALELSLDLQRSAYDCLYLALAMATGDRVVTADVKFERAVSASPVHAAFIRRL